VIEKRDKGEEAGGKVQSIKSILEDVKREKWRTYLTSP
jgi:hypothetical protein